MGGSVNPVFEILAPHKVDQFEVVPPSVSSNHWLAATGDVLKGLAGGFGAGATQTITSVSRLLNKIPGIGETLAPSEGIATMRLAGTPTNTTEKVGAGFEQMAELLATGNPSGNLLKKMALGAAISGGSTAVHQGGTTAGVSPESVAVSSALGGASPAIESGAKALLTSKAARGAVNESVMATARDVTYGNPAKALLDEDITSPFTGDLEKYKDAIRSGASLPAAAQAAGGRIAAVSQKIGQLAPELNAALSASTVRIPSSTLTDVIDEGIKSIQASRGVTAEEENAAIVELNAIKQAALKIPAAPGATATAWSPLEANTVKQEIGQAVNWEGKERVGQLVEPIRKQIYGSLKDAVNSAVPESALINERLTNLLAAQSDVNKLAGFEEVGRGRSMGGVIGPSWIGRVEAMAGRFIPALSWLTPQVGAAARTAAAPIVTALRTPQP